jgi:glycosyltransferase involved in cell wall biosynthesis
MEKWRNEQNRNAMSGSEIMMTRLVKELGEDYLEDFQIILSRPSLHELEEDKIRILWCHDLAGDPEAESLGNKGWCKFHKLVFVSHWQQQQFIERYQIPWERTVVIKNAIDPIEVNLEKKFSSFKKGDTINLVYSTTPHRGLAILVPVFENLLKSHDDIHLHVFSSFKIYGWEERDKHFQPLYDRIKDNEHMTYHGSVPNPELRQELTRMHIHAYPSMWLETSCVSLIEAMSAGLMCVHPNLGALYETASNWTFMYNWISDPQQHAHFFHSMLDQAIGAVRSNDDNIQIKLMGQKSYADLFYSWNARKMEWKMFLDSVKDLPREIEKPPGETFKYSVG